MLRSRGAEETLTSAPLPLCSSALFDPVVWRFFGDDDVVNVTFAQAG